MVGLLEVFSFILFFMSGFFAARYIKTRSLFPDILLLIFAVLCTWVGRNTYLLKVFDFELLLPSVIQVILSGMLVRHLILYRAAGVKS